MNCTLAFHFQNYFHISEQVNPLIVFWYWLPQALKKNSFFINYFCNALKVQKQNVKGTHLKVLIFLGES